jgi:very-short-patch-repair endonuclease
MCPISRLAALSCDSNRSKAKELRASMTEAEQRLWFYLRARRFENRKFRRQVPMGPYIVDFVCEQARLIVEVDGGQHVEQRRYDDQRTQWLRAQGYEVVRFWNDEVMRNIDAVGEALSRALTKSNPLPRPLSQRRGEQII